MVQGRESASVHEICTVPAYCTVVEIDAAEMCWRKGLSTTLVSLASEALVQEGSVWFGLGSGLSRKGSRT
jgi:hypothetical protein